MDKKEITEAGIKLIAFYAILKPITGLIVVTLNAALGGMGFAREFVPSVVASAVTIAVAVLVIRKTDWILARLYRTT